MPNLLQKWITTDTKIIGHNPRVDLCPKSTKRMKKNGCFERKMGFGMVGDKTGNLGIWVAGGGYGWWRTAGGGVLVVGKVAVGGGCGWFFWI
jgi:hypothetical protein